MNLKLNLYKLICSLAVLLLLSLFITCGGNSGLNTNGEQKKLTADQYLSNGIKSYDNGNYELALTLFKEAEKKKSGEAAYKISEMYEYGKGVKKDKNKKIKWLKKAAKLKYPDAIFDLGFEYYSGDNISKSYKKAVNLWREGAELGHLDSQYYLAYKLHEIVLRGYNSLSSEKIRSLLEEADKWFTILADKNYKSSKEQLALLKITKYKFKEVFMIKPPSGSGY